MTDIKLSTHHHFVNMTGQKFHRWTVICLVKSSNKNCKWLCRCDCGNEKNVFGTGLRRGNSKSCGCLNKEIISKLNSTHGMARTPKYDIWHSMKQRCLNKNSKAYKDWGGRGITICDRWVKFEAFFEDMGFKPSPQHSIDRIDNEKGYSKENCRWATRKEQTRNTRRNRKILFNGEYLCLAEIEEKYGISQKLISKRLRRGWTEYDALVAPKYKHHLKAILQN